MKEYWKKQKILEELPTVNVSIVDEKLYGIVNCTFCSKEIRVGTQKREKKERWVISNFITHMSKKHGKKSTDTKSNQQTTITQFCPSTSREKSTDINVKVANEETAI